jgi:hypothetical protein
MDQTILRRAAMNLGEAKRLIRATGEGLRTSGKPCGCCELYVFDNIHEKRLSRQVESLERKVEALWREFEKVAAGVAEEEAEL